MTYRTAMPKWRPDQNARLAIAVHELAMAVRKHDSPQFAFDQLGPELKRTLRLTKDSAWLRKKENSSMKPRYARDQAEPIESNRGDIDALITLVSEIADGDKTLMDRFFVALEKACPGSVGEMSGNVAEDEDDEGGPSPFKGMPKPGGGERIKFSSLEAKTPAQRRREAEEKENGYAEDSYRAMFGDTHIGLDPIVPMPPNPPPLLAMDGSADDDDYFHYFPQARRIGQV